MPRAVVSVVLCLVQYDGEIFLRVQSALDPAIEPWELWWVVEGLANPEADFVGFVEQTIVTL